MRSFFKKEQGSGVPSGEKKSRREWGVVEAWRVRSVIALFGRYLLSVGSLEERSMDQK